MGNAFNNKCSQISFNLCVENMKCVDSERGGILSHLRPCLIYSVFQIPFATQTICNPTSFEHLKSRLVRISDPDCISDFYLFSVRRVLNHFFKSSEMKVEPDVVLEAEGESEDEDGPGDYFF